MADPQVATTQPATLPPDMVDPNSNPLTQDAQRGQPGGMVTMKDRAGAYQVPASEVAGMPGVRVLNPNPQNGSPPPQEKTVSAEAPLSALAVPGMPIEMRKVLIGLAGPESGGNPNVLYGGDDMRKYPDRPGYMGFPDWPGKEGPKGISHAAAEHQMEPDTWKAAATELGLDNFRDPVQRAKASAWLADKSYKQLTGGRDLISDQKAGHDVLAVLHSAGSPWATQHADNDPKSDLQGQLLGDATRARAQGEKAYTEAQALEQKYRDTMGKEPPGSDEFRQAYKDARDAAQRVEKTYNDLIKTPPIYKPTDAMEQFGSVGVIIAGLMGLRSRQHMTAALGAAGDAMRSMNQQNFDQFKMATDIWKTQAEMGMHAASMARDDLKEILEAHHASYDELKGQLAQLQTAHGMAKFDVEHADDVLKSTNAALEKGQEAKLRLQNQTSIILGRKEVADAHDDAAHPWVASYKDWWNEKILEANATGQPLPDAAARAAKRAEFQKDAAKAVASGKQGAAGEGFKESDVDYWANVLRSGGHLPPGLSRTAQGSAIVQQIMKKMPELGGGDPGAFIANVATVKADDRSLSNMTKMADAATSFERTASQNFDLALKLSKDTVPTDWGPILNRWVMSGETQYGDTKVPAYVTAMLTGANEYAKIMSGSTGAQGSTVDSRREAAELFSPYLSANQIDRVVAVAKADMGNRKQSLYGQLDDIKERLHHAGVPGTTESLMGPKKEGAAPAPASSTAPAGAPVREVIQNGMRFNKDTGEFLGQAHQ